MREGCWRDAGCDDSGEGLGRDTEGRTEQDGAGRRAGRRGCGRARPWHGAGVDGHAAQCTDEAVLVEPASPYEEEIDRVVAWVRAHDLTLVAILATHHHPDHIGGASALCKRLGLPLWAHAMTAQRLEGVVKVHRHLEDNETIVLRGGTIVRAVFTPGHAPGHQLQESKTYRSRVVHRSIRSVVVDQDRHTCQRLGLPSLLSVGKFESMDSD